MVSKSSKKKVIRGKSYHAKVRGTIEKFARSHRPDGNGYYNNNTP